MSGEGGCNCGCVPGVNADELRERHDALREAARAAIAEWDDDLGGAISISAAERLRAALGDEKEER